MKKKSRKIESDEIGVRRFKLLADDNRLKMVKLLFSGPVKVGDIASALGIEQSLASHHLSTLRKEGIVTTTRQGKEIYYNLAEEVRKGCDQKELELRCCKIVLR